MTATYYELPSDCRGDGYDIALASHADDKPLVETAGDGTVITREKVFLSGFFAGYRTTEIGPGAPKGATAVRVQWVAEANGAWKWARGGRGRIRVAIVDETRAHRQTNYSGYLGTLYESGSLAFGYSGGKWGYGAALAQAKAIASAYSSATGLKLIG